MGLKNRFHLVDHLRGLAVLLMIIFHFSYDLNAFGIIHVDFYRDIFWWTFPRVIVFLFLFSMGLSLPIAHYPKVKWPSFWRRFLKIALGALAISIGTYFMFPERWIYFGTLHCIALTSLMALPLINYAWPNLLLSMAILIPAVFFGKTIPWIQLHRSMDYIPPFPWMGVVCLGIFAWHKKLHQLKTPELSALRGLEVLGRHSFWIYMAHQPILFGLAYLLSKLLTI